MTHFYLEDGTPFYEVPNKSKGGMRPANIRDARQARASPSVTGIIGLVDKPGLNIWKENQMILAALTHPGIAEGLSMQDTIALIRKDAQAQAKEAAERGTAIHDAIEQAFTFAGTADPDMMEYVIPVLDCLIENCGENCGWKPEAWFCHPRGFGGKVDLHNDQWVIDFKTKEGDVSNEKGWPEMLRQLVAYDIGLGNPGRRLANVIVSRDIPGSVKWIEWKDVDRDKEWQQFQRLLDYWWGEQKEDWRER